MKSIESLKSEQSSLKEKLVELIDFINGDEYFTLSVADRSRINQERLGLEMQLNALTNRIYNTTYTYDTSFSTLLPLLMSVFSTNSFTSSDSSSVSNLEAILEESSSSSLVETSEEN